MTQYKVQGFKLVNNRLVLLLPLFIDAKDAHKARCKGINDYQKLDPDVIAVSVNPTNKALI